MAASTYAESMCERCRHTGRIDGWTMCRRCLHLTADEEAAEIAAQKKRTPTVRAAVDRPAPVAPAASYRRSAFDWLPMWVEDATPTVLGLVVAIGVILGVGWAGANIVEAYQGSDVYQEQQRVKEETICLDWKGDGNLVCVDPKEVYGS